MNTTQFSIKKMRAGNSDASQILVLHFDNQPVSCIYRTPVALPGTIPGTVNINVPVCGNNCPMFNLNKELGLLHFRCTKSDINVNMEEIEPGLKLIQE